MNSYCIQENYPEQYCHCYGCGLNNKFGLGIRSFWNGSQATAMFRPLNEHIAVPGYVYGGLLASLVDCHGIATASAAMSEKTEKNSQHLQLKRYVTANLNVDFLKPTPLGTELKLLGKPQSINKRKVDVLVEVYVGNILTVRGKVIAVPMPETMA